MPIISVAGHFIYQAITDVGLIKLGGMELYVAFFTMVDHVLVEVKRIMQVVLRGTGETGTDSRGQRQREVGFKTGV